MKNLNSTDMVIDNLKAILRLKNDVALASILGVSNKTISGWKTRNTLDYNLIMSKCEGVNFHWLFTAEGDAFSPNEQGRRLRDTILESRVTELIELKGMSPVAARNLAIAELETFTLISPTIYEDSEEQQQDELGKSADKPDGTAYKTELEKLRSYATTLEQDKWKLQGKVEALQELLSTRFENPSQPEEKPVRKAGRGRPRGSKKQST